MDIRAEQKFLRVSSRKLREVAGSIRGIKSPALALEYLEAMPKKAALPLAKVIKQAVANAKNNMKVSEDTLKIKTLVIDEGPVYKRWQPISRGQAHPIKKYTSHIRVILETEVKKSTDDRLQSTAKEEDKGVSKKTVVGRRSTESK